MEARMGILDFSECNSFDFPIGKNKLSSQNYYKIGQKMHFSKWEKNSSITGYLKNQLDRKEIVDFFQKQTSKKENYKHVLNFYLRRWVCFRSL